MLCIGAHAFLRFFGHAPPSGTELGYEDEPIRSGDYGPAQVIKDLLRLERLDDSIDQFLKKLADRGVANLPR